MKLRFGSLFALIVFAYFYGLLAFALLRLP